MRTRRFFIVPAILALALLLITPASALFLPSDGQAATLVLGQPNFTSSGVALTQTGMFQPTGVAVDPTTGKVFVADGRNHRVLRFADSASLTNGAAAEAVLGEPDFTTTSAELNQHGFDTPFSVAVDSSGRLWVTDGEHTRVLRFDNASSKPNGANADGVLGQPDFVTQILATTQNGMAGPGHIAVDSSGRLWVADAANSRVLRYDNAASKANGANADGVLGQPDFNSSTPSTAQNGMNFPVGVAVDASGRLWVADYLNSRVLRFDNAAAKANGANADGVLGQPNFTASATNTSQNGMSFPRSATLDGHGRLYVSDSGNRRILIFNSAASLGNGANASYVLGQPDFTTSICSGPFDTTLCQPQGVFYDQAAQVLWVADDGDNRVLMYGAPYGTIHIQPFVGLVRRFLPPGVAPIGKISIQTMDGSIHTFDWTADTRILPRRAAGGLGVGSFVTLLARVDGDTGQYLAEQIVVHPEGAGPGFPTEAPTPTATPAGVP